jgi:hypothetical protein
MKDTFWEISLWKMTPLGTTNVYKEKYLSQGWTPVLKGASGRTHPLFKGVFKHLCHCDPAFESLGPIDKTM